MSRSRSWIVALATAMSCLQVRSAWADEPVAVEPDDEPATTADVPEYDATATVEAPPRDLTRRSLEQAEVATIAGARGDTLRALEILPGVGRPAFGEGFLLVRGTSPEDTEVFLDGAPVLFLYHLGGFSSFFQSKLLDRVELYPGNFSVRFGRRVGAIVDVRVRDPEPDRIHAMLELNVLEGALWAEAPLGSIGSISLAARRSHLDFFFESIVPDDAFEVVAAPVYWDYQLVASLAPTRSDRVRALLYGSDDHFELVFSQPDDRDPTFRGALGGGIGFHHAQVEWEHEHSATLEHDVQLTLAHIGYEFQAGEAFHLDVQGPALFGRTEWRWRALPSLRVSAGLDAQLYLSEVVFHGTPIPQDEGGGRQDDDLNDAVDVTNDMRYFRPAAYVEAELSALDPLTLLGGVRVDYFGDVGAWTVDPRLQARLALGGGTTLKAGVGMFAQPPDWGEAIPGIGNENLDPTRAVHASAGVEHHVNERLELGVEGYFRWLWDRVVSTEPGAAVSIENDGVGRIVGVEASARLSPGDDPFFGSVSYGLSRSERSDHGGAWRLFDYDQTHNLTIAAGARLAGGWELSATFRLVTGNPLTPVTGATYDVDRDLYVPAYGAVNSARNPMFHRLDMRIAKSFRVGIARLSAYLDVQNVYDHRNREGFVHGYDYRSTEDLPGLSFLPSLGLRGEL